MRKLLCICLLAALLLPYGVVHASTQDKVVPTADPSIDTPVVSNAPLSNDVPAEPSTPLQVGNSISKLQAASYPMPFDSNAPSVLLCEEQSGQVIFEKNADEKRPVASITKLMSILLILEAIQDGRLDLEDSIKTSSNAASTGGSQALLDGDSQYPAKDLLKSVIVASANDAVVALAEHLYGSETAFVKRMNGRAAELGLYDTLYQNCTGLPAQNQYTTARDTAQLARIIAQHDLYFTYSGIWLDELLHKNGRKTELTNTNRLIRTYEGADGLKTGSTSDAKFCIVASATRDGMRLIAVVLGAPNSVERFAEAKKVLDYGFAHFYMYDVAKEGETFHEGLTVKGSSTKTVPIVAGEPVRAMVMKGEEGQITSKAILPELLQAPLKKGERIGEIIVYKNDTEIARVPAVVANDVEGAGVWTSILKILTGWMR